MVVAYVCGGVAAAAFIAGAHELHFPAAKIPAEPSFPILPDPPPDDPRSDIRQALDAHPASDLGEALDAASGVRRRLHGYCAKCGYPLDPPLLTPDCNGSGSCDRRLRTPLAHRLRFSSATSPLRVHPEWMAKHPEAG